MWIILLWYLMVFSFKNKTVLSYIKIKMFFFLCLQKLQNIIQPILVFYQAE